MPRLRSPRLGQVLGSRGGGRSELRGAGRLVHHSPTTHRAVQNPLPVPCPRSHPRCLRSAYCPVLQDSEGQARPSPLSPPLASLQPMAQPRYYLFAPPPPLPAPSLLSSNSGQRRHVTLTDPPSPWHAREGRGGAEEPRGRLGALAGRAVPGPPRGRLEGDSRKKQPQLHRQDQACWPSVCGDRHSGFQQRSLCKPLNY